MHRPVRQYQHGPSQLSTIVPAESTSFATPGRNILSNLPSGRFASAGSARRWRQERVWLAELATRNMVEYEKEKQGFERNWFRKFENLLDSAESGPHWLSDQHVANIVANEFRESDNKWFRLDAYTIMTNHVHAVFKPLPIPNHTDDYYSLASIMQSLKGRTALKANKLLGRTGAFWAHENFDRWIRTSTEWQRAIAYVLNNPVKANYVETWRAWKWSYTRDTNAN